MLNNFLRRVHTLVKRHPVVTIMGHVDHGKTTLLDKLRRSNIVEKEFGGITQHIGAFVVPFNNKNKTEMVTFLDTPGHAAFAAMRQRGANVTDIVVLVIACEDGVLDQTIESINYANKSGVPIIVAINKIDKYSNSRDIDSRIEHIRKSLIANDVICEEDGGEVQLVKISARKGIGIDDLKESILALAETLELYVDANAPGSGTIIESKVDPHKGKVCNVLVQDGQIKKGDYIIAGGTNWARIRMLFDEYNQSKQYCNPGFPIQITGWREEILPSAGDQFIQVENESKAKSIIRNMMTERKLEDSMEQARAWQAKFDHFQKIHHDNLIKRREKGILYGRTYFVDGTRGTRPKESVNQRDDNEQTVSIILKCDVHGSLDALLSVLDSYDNNKQHIKMDIIRHGVGPISENDLLSAEFSPNSVIYGFNVKLADQKLYSMAKSKGIELKIFNVIYSLIDDLKGRLAKRMPFIDEEHVLGRATILQEYIIDEGKKKVHVAGSRCDRGQLLESGFFKLERNGELILENLKVKTMKHLKDNVKKIDNGMDCGISFTHEGDIKFKPGDTLVCYEKKRNQLKFKWNIKGFD